MALTIRNKNVISNRSVEDILPSTLFIMKFCGLWQPSVHMSSLLKVLYVTYTIVSMFIITSITLSLVCVVLLSKNIKISLFENSFLLLTLFNGCIKATVLLSKREKVLSLLSSLTEDQFQPESPAESKIQNKFDEEAKQFTHYYAIIVGLAVTTMYGVIPFQKEDERIKVLNVWRPYDLTNKFWITYIFELFGHILVASCHIVSDTLIPGIMIQLCCQLKFIQHRLNNLPLVVKNVDKSIHKLNAERFCMRNIIKHHNSVFTIAKELQNTFWEVLFFQFSLSLIVICFSIYKISNEAFNSNSAVMYSYLLSMLTQLFLYCWYGNQLMLNSIELNEEIAAIDWLSLGIEARRSLVILMISSTQPIIISIQSLFFVNLNLFVTILRGSYSIFNVLKQSSL